VVPTLPTGYSNTTSGPNHDINPIVIVTLTLSFLMGQCCCNQHRDCCSITQLCHQIRTVLTAII